MRWCAFSSCLFISVHSAVWATKCLRHHHCTVGVRSWRSWLRWTTNGSNGTHKERCEEFHVSQISCAKSRGIVEIAMKKIEKIEFTRYLHMTKVLKVSQYFVKWRNRVSAVYFPRPLTAFFFPAEEKTWLMNLNFHFDAYQVHMLDY